MVLEKSQETLNKAVNFLKNGKIVICPTDTVYGFIALAENKKAVSKIYKIKKRPKSKPLAVFVKDFKMANELAEINAKQKKIITLRDASGQAKYWPGKYTFVLKKKKIKLFDGGKSTIALRIPKYKFLNDLLKKINKPLAQTSVNISSQPALIKINDIINQFNNQDILIINGGDIKNTKASKILDLTKEKINIIR